MSDIKNGGPAFPTTFEHYGNGGMTMRDYFAAKAMQGIMAEMWPDLFSSGSAEFYHA